MLKMTGCNPEGEFTCNDGQCIKMEERCDQVLDCRDGSDEIGCQIILFKNQDAYNKNIPPITKNDPVNVSISITLMKVVEIEETDHSIHLQFKINLQWKDNRVKYQNLKDKTSLNALTDADIRKLWLPFVIYENIDQKESTRLGEYGNGEWVTSVSVVKEGTFAPNELDELDEAESFEGPENTF